MSDIMHVYQVVARLQHTAPPVPHTASVKKGLGLAEVTIYMYITGGPVSLLSLQPEGPPPDPSPPGHDRLGLSTARSGCTGRRPLPLYMNI